MRQTFILNLFLVLIINALIKPLYIFGIDAQVQDILGVHIYGGYFALLNFAYLFQFIQDPGLQNWNAQYVPKATASLSLHFSNVLALKLILGTIFILVVMVSSPYVGAEPVLMVFIVLQLVLSSLFMLFRSTFAGMGYYFYDTLISALDKVLMIVIIGYIVWYRKDEAFSILMFVQLQVLCSLIACIILGVLLLPKLQLSFSLVSLSHVKKIIVACLPFVITLLFMTIYNKIDGVMLGFMIDDNNEQAGIYASAYRFYEALNMIGYLFAALLLPMFASNIQNKPVLIDLHNLGVKYIGLLSIVILCFFLVYGNDVMTLLYSMYDSRYLYALWALIGGFVFVGLASIFGCLLISLNHVKHLNLIYGIGLVFNIVLNYIAIPRYGAIGAAVTTLCTQFVVLIGKLYLTKKLLHFSIPIKTLILLVVFGILGFGVFKSIYTYFSLGWFVGLCISAFICVLLSIILKLIKKDELLSMVNITQKK